LRGELGFSFVETSGLGTVEMLKTIGADAEAVAVDYERTTTSKE
jgi:hypothetical protein